MQSVAYYNGEMAHPDELRVPFLDRVCFFGDGVYDATMAVDGVVVFFEDHLDRFANSMRFVKIEPAWSREWLAGQIQRVVDACGAPSQFVYWQVTRGTAPRAHEFPQVEPNLWIYAEPRDFADLDREVSLVSQVDKRFSYCNVKTLNLLPNVLAAQEAVANGCHETVFVRDGYVTEGSHCNIHMIADGVFVTHPADEHILPGSARKHMIAACGQLGIPVEERLYTLDELMAADEVLVTSSSSIALRACSIDGKAVGRRDEQAYQALRQALSDELAAYVNTR